MRSSPIAAAGALVAVLGLAALGAQHRDVVPSHAPLALAPPERPATPDTTPALIDVNHADAETLERLPRIGPALAARIVADREAHGAYPRVESLARVSGIGPRTVEQLRPFVTVGTGGADAGDGGVAPP